MKYNNYSKIDTLNIQHIINTYEPNMYFTQAGLDEEIGLPRGLNPKINRVCTVVTASAPAMLTYMFNLYRVDYKDQALDEQPFLLTLRDYNTVVAAGFFDHGNWPERTHKMPHEFFSNLDNYGIGASWYVPTFPSSASGLASEIDNHHQGNVLRFSMKEQEKYHDNLDTFDIS